MPDLDRPQLAMLVALGLAICVLGARYVIGQAGDRVQPDGAGGGAAAGAVDARDDARATRESAEAQGAIRVGSADGGRVIVHVAGAVHRPGVYRLASGSRVDDALRRAGGPRRRADLAALNLAARLEDGRQVLVPERPPATGSTAAGGSRSAATAATPPVPGAAGTAAPVNLNTATLEQLDGLDGIGPGLAKRILDYRTANGGFNRVEELAQVPGIGPMRLATLTPLVTV